MTITLLKTRHFVVLHVLTDVSGKPVASISGSKCSKKRGENWVRALLREVSNYLPKDIASYPRRRESPLTLLWEREISQGEHTSNFTIFGELCLTRLATTDFRKYCMFCTVLYFAFFRSFDADLVQFGIKVVFYPVPIMHQSTQRYNQSMLIHVATAALGRIPRQSLALMRCLDQTDRKYTTCIWIELIVCF
jgi:hypothetical protein